VTVEGRERRKQKGKIRGQRGERKKTQL